MGRLGKAAIAAALALAVQSPAWAQGVLGGPDAAWYVGASVGQGSQGVCSLATGGTCDDSDTGYRIFAGYEVNRYFALEIGYNQVGDATFSTVGITQTLETTVYDLLAVGKLPLTDRFSAYGKLGIYRASTELKSSPSLFPGTSNDSNGMAIGLGLQFDFTKNLGLRAGWMQYANVSFGGFAGNDINQTNIGVLWRFK